MMKEFNTCPDCEGRGTNCFWCNGSGYRVISPVHEQGSPSPSSQNLHIHESANPSPWKQELDQLNEEVDQISEQCCILQQKLSLERRQLQSDRRRLDMAWKNVNILHEESERAFFYLLSFVFPMLFLLAVWCMLLSLKVFD